MITQCNLTVNTNNVSSTNKALVLYVHRFWHFVLVALFSMHGILSVGILFCGILSGLHADTLVNQAYTQSDLFIIYTTVRCHRLTYEDLSSASRRKSNNLVISTRHTERHCPTIDFFSEVA